MKKVLIVLILMCSFFILISCKKENVVEETTHMTMNEEVSNKKEFLNELNNFISSIALDYSIVLYSLDISGAYGQTYALYDVKNVNELNYPNYNAIATFTVYFENNSDASKIVDLLYTFPMKEDESEKNLEIEYELYVSLINGVLSNSSEEKINEVFTFFKISSKEEYLKIYNEEEKYDYKIIDMGENKENYLSTLFLKGDKKINLEYHDAKFENDN